MFRAICERLFTEKMPLWCSPDGCKCLRFSCLLSCQVTWNIIWSSFIRAFCTVQQILPFLTQRHVITSRCPWFLHSHIVSQLSHPAGGMYTWDGLYWLALQKAGVDSVIWVDWEAILMFTTWPDSLRGSVVNLRTPLMLMPFLGNQQSWGLLPFWEHYCGVCPRLCCLYGNQVLIFLSFRNMTNTLVMNDHDQFLRIQRNTTGRLWGPQTTVESSPDWSCLLLLREGFLEECLHSLLFLQ